MSPSTRKKLLIGGGGAVVVLILALLIAPSFFDLNKYKPELVAQVKTATGRDLVLDGPVTLSLLPTPTVGVSGVRFVNVAGSKNANMVEVKSIAVKPSLFALLSGNIEVGSVTLVEPKIVLEINAEGKPNWEFAPSVEAAKPAAPKPSSPKPLSLGELVLENGTLLFSDSKAGISIVAEKANFTASVGSLDGPYALKGGATINGAPLKVDASVGAKGSNGYATDFALEANGKLGFKGTLSELGPNARLAGTATVSTDSLTGFVATLAGLAGQPAPPLPRVLASKFTFEGSVEASQVDFAAKDFNTLLGGSNGAGSLSVKLKPLVVEAKISSPKLDMDKVLAELSLPDTVPAVPAKPATAPAAVQPLAQAPTQAPTDKSLLDGVTAKVSVDVGEVIVNKQPIRNVALELDARNGVVAVPRLGATLPGDLVLQGKSTLSGDPARPTVSGDFSLVGPKLRETLNWLGVDVSSVPPDKLTKVSLKGRMASTSGNVQVTDATFELDDVKGTAGVLATFSVPFSTVTTISIDSIDLDSFMPKPGEAKKAAPAAKPAAPPSAAAARTEAAAPSFGLKLKIAKAIYKKETIAGIALDVALQGSLFKLNQADVSDLAGARLAVRGSVADVTASNRRPDIAFNFEAPDIDKVLVMFGGTATGLGKVTASGAVTGTEEQMSLRELTVASGGDTVRVTGVVSMPGASTGTPSSVGYKGSFALNNQAIECAVEVKVADRPSITADLKAGTLDLDKLQTHAAAVRPAAPARGQAAAAPAAASTPIDTGPMRGVDATVKLVAGTLISGPLRLNNADLAITLKNGVLTVEHFKSGLFGGTLNLSGTVDGSKPVVAIDFKGDASNIALGEMLRETSGSNVFGGRVRVTVDGQLNATGITLKGGGSTSEQIASSMVGGMQLGGHVFAGADKALITLGTGAANAIGGVVDNTLGNLLGAVGQRSPTNMLSAASVLLERFVNRNNPISGQLAIANGVLTDKSLVISGDRATANIVTRTNLAQKTTATTVNFMLSEDPSAAYIVATINGPLSNPSYGVNRGSAKDPPGVVNTLTNGISNGVQQVPSFLPKLPIPNIFGR
jgi:uncharacterized protein involved in outer membrane biogenesis